MAIYGSDVIGESNYASLKISLPKQTQFHDLKTSNFLKKKEKVLYFWHNIFKKVFASKSLNTNLIHIAQLDFHNLIPSLFGKYIF